MTDFYKKINRETVDPEKMIGAVVLCRVLLLGAVEPFSIVYCIIMLMIGFVSPVVLCEPVS